MPGVSGAGVRGGASDAAPRRATARPIIPSDPGPPPLGTLDTGSQVCNLAWARHAHELVSTHGYSQNQVALWRYGGAGGPGSLTRLATLTGHSGPVRTLVRCGDKVFSGSYDKTVRVWDVNTHKCLATLVGHSGAVRALAASDTVVFSGSDDTTIRVGGSASWLAGPAAAVPAAAVPAAAVPAAADGCSRRAWG